MKKIIFFLGILIILSSCTHNKLSIEKVDAPPQNVKKEMELLLRDEPAGGYFLMESGKEQYLYVQSDRRNRSMITDLVTKAAVSEKNGRIILLITTKQENLEKVKDRDSLYKIEGIKNMKETQLKVNGESHAINSIISIQ